MSLPSHFVFDTETDDWSKKEAGAKLRTCMLQLCPMSATSLDDVAVYLGPDCYDRFLDDFDETLYDMECHVYNLGYEYYAGFEEVLLRRYTNEDYELRRPEKGCFMLMESNGQSYKVQITNQYGYTMEITDDMRRAQMESMKKTATGIRNEYERWFPYGMDTKEVVEYNNGWFDEDHPDHERFIHYGKVDAFSQAMIMRYFHEQEFTRLTSASEGFGMALRIRYGSEGWKNKRQFVQDYPPLDPEAQAIAERNLLGGFVWGKVGTYQGTFCHIDYSSSYPYEYAFGKMFKGRVNRVRPDYDGWDAVRKAPGMFRWYICSFDFKKGKKKGVYAISGRECRTKDDPMIGRGNKKMTEGRCTRVLRTESYLEELGKHYEISNLVIHEMWFAPRYTGDFKEFIAECYHVKQTAPKKGAKRNVWKGFMNAGIHGKTITKTKRKKTVYRDGERQQIEEQGEPTYCAMIGFTAMMNARERLLRDCRVLTEHGYTIYACDTDSIVVGATEQQVREALGADKFAVKGGSLEETLGRFEFEKYEPMVCIGEGTRHEEWIPNVDDPDYGTVEFTQFKCWGLKRYLERTNGKYRKSAFAGMSQENQEELLMGFKTDGSELSWQQNGRRKDKHGKYVQLVTKHATAEDVMDHGDLEPSVHRVGKVQLLRFLDNVWKDGEPVVGTYIERGSEGL